MPSLAVVPSQYQPPLQLQHEQIWTLCLADHLTSRTKVSEYNYTKKKCPLLSWPGVQKRLEQNPKRYSGIVGIVSTDIVTIDIDLPDLPPTITQLLQDHPTHFHQSFSGNGWHLYYHCPQAISGNKKCRRIYEDQDKTKQKYGEAMQGMFITTTPHLVDDYSKDQIATVTPQQLAKYIPELQTQLQPQAKTNFNQYQYMDPDKLKLEAGNILKKIPIDPDHLIQIVFETKLKDMEYSSYDYWLTVAQALAHLAIQLASVDPQSMEYFANLFHEWSQQGVSYQGQTDCDEKFYQCVESTKAATNPIITFDTLRKIAHNYRIPWSEFTKLNYDKKGQVTGVDATDPRNYRDVIQRLELKMVQTSEETYIEGPPSVIKHYFSDSQSYFLTQDNPRLSIPFQYKYRSDDALSNRLIILFREMGISKVAKAHPLFTGFQLEGIKKIDLIYNWMANKPWDKIPRIEQMIKDSLTIDMAIAEEAEVSEEFYHSLVLKHLTHMAGIRAKNFRFTNDEEKPDDNFKKTESCLIISGYQRKGKTTWVESLMPFKANASISVTPTSAKTTLEMQRALQGTFIYNIDEIDEVLEKMDSGEFKSVITQEKDSFRTMYSQKTDSHLRAAGFFGTTNAKQMKLDKTGNRRIWIIPVKGRCDASVFYKCDYQQIWAELLHKAEQLNGDTWGITGQEEALINKTANTFRKETQSTKMLDIVFTDEGDHAIYTKEDINFEQFFIDLKQMAWRGLNGKCFFSLSGQKAYKHVQAMSMFHEDVQFSLKSFGYEIADFCDQLFGWENKTMELGNHVYKNGVIYIYTGKAKRSKYHFIPFKKYIDEAIEQGLIAPEVLLAPQ